MAKLTGDDVKHLATLAKLELTEAEVTLFASEISKILDFVEQLQGADISGLEPTSQVTGLLDVKREDEVEGYGYDPLSLLTNVPEVEDNQIKVRRVL